jgi:hypothetical protein
MSYKKWIHKYKFLQEEENETQEQFDAYVKQFEEDFVLVNTDESNNIPVTVDPLPERIANNLCKPIFKRLSKILHPDKGGNEEDFNKSSENYRNQDIIGLYVMAEKYKIDIEDLIIDELIPLFESSCELIEEKISKKTKSIAWDWYNIEDPKSKEITIDYFKEELNIIPRVDQENK